MMKKFERSGLFKKVALWFLAMLSLSLIFNYINQLLPLSSNNTFKTNLIINYEDIEQKSFIEWMNDEDNPVAQDDPKLLKYVRENYILPMNMEPYNLVTKSDNPSSGQLQVLLNVLKKVKNGFFVELGANDGEWGSNTLYLEKVLGWNGLLIEGSPSTFKQLITKNRKAWHSNAAASTISSPMKATFYENPSASIWGGLTYRFYHENDRATEVQCIPIYTLLLSINQTVVDFLSLDLEGSELDVLRTIPFDKLRINSLAVEVINGREGPEPVKELMRKNGFFLVGTVSGLDDLIFINSKFVREIGATF